MHVSIVGFRLQNMDDAEYSQICDELAPAFAAVPGLLSKVWLHGEGDARGGVYLWEDKAAFEAFLASAWAEQSHRIRTSPNLRYGTTRSMRHHRESRAAYRRQSGNSA